MTNEDYIIEGIRLEEKLKKSKYDNEISSVKSVVDLIKNNDIEGLQTLDVCKEMMHVIAKDCVEEINLTKLIFLKIYNTYENSTNIIVQRAIEEIGAKLFPYDPDASLISSYIFCKTIVIPEESEWKIYYNKAYEYKIQNCKENESYFRGDTMTSWVTSLNQCIESFKITELPEKEEERIKFLCNPQNYGSEFKAIYGEVEGFLNAVYTIGNFCPVPEGFNGGRSGGGNYDYWDLTLMKIRDWYMEENEKHLNDLLRIKTECPKNKERIKYCQEWLKVFGGRKKGKEGWQKFVKTLHMQDYVYCKDNKNSKYKVSNDDEKSYEVIPFWPGHEWDEGTVKVKFPTGDEIKKAFETMAAIIEARTKRIAEALVNAK